MIHEDMKRFFDGYPSTAHPMAMLSAMICSLSSYYPESLDVRNKEMNDVNIARLIAKVRTIAAYSYKKAIGQPFVYPKNSLSYCANFLNMMFSVPAEPYEIDEDVVKVLNQLFILHADHEQNCSTSTVRMVGSAQANVFASVAAGICALWGPLHGGANQEVLEMLEVIQKDGGDPSKFIELAKKKDSGFRLMGFGHRVYKNYDPRAKVIKAACDKVLPKLKRQDPLLDIARHLEEAALKDPYFVDRKLYPNVDFYSGLIYRAHRHPDQHVHRHVRHRPATGLAGPLERDDRGSDHQDRAAPPDLHRARRSATTFRWSNGNSRRHVGRRFAGGQRRPLQRIEQVQQRPRRSARDRGGPSSWRTSPGPPGSAARPAPGWPASSISTGRASSAR